MVLAITGATGFIGVRVTAAARARGWPIRALVRDLSKAPKGPGVEAVEADLADTTALRAALDGATAVCHLAAYVPARMGDPDEAARCFEVNALGTLRLLEAAQAAGAARMVAASSASAYRFSEKPVAEDAPLYPSARAPYYLASKIAGEVFIAHYAESRRLSAAILRVSSVYGPGMPPGGLIHAVASQLLAGQTAVLRNAGCYGGDYVFVDDVVRAIIAALESDIEGAVNVGLGRRVLIDEIGRTLADVCSVPHSLLQFQKPGERPDSGQAAIDISRARAALGFEPTPLREGLARFVESLSSR
ncbi:MAG: NAD(P)-dependent oxidoreductase [Amphiplicatus sp.]|jgi:UDP-glucose 4-epimerase